MFKIIGADGQIYGPVTAEQLRKWIAQNRANARTLAQPEGGAEWKPLSELVEFAPELQAANPPPATTGPGAPPFASADASARATNKVAAGVCGILLGGLGIHKFILGYTGAGIIMLLVTLLTCGLAYGLVHVIGLIEGIIYLTKTDEDFVRLYVDGRREWF